MHSLEILILKLLSINTLPTRSIARSKVSSLDHKLLNHSVKTGALVVQWLAGDWGVALLACAERAEVLGGFWDNVGVELKDDTPGWLVIQADVEEHLWTRSHDEFGVCLSWGCVVVVLVEGVCFVIFNKR